MSREQRGKRPQLRGPARKASVSRVLYKDFSCQTGTERESGRGVGLEDVVRAVRDLTVSLKVSPRTADYCLAIVQEELDTLCRKKVFRKKQKSATSLKDIQIQSIDTRIELFYEHMTDFTSLLFNELSVVRKQLLSVNEASDQLPTALQPNKPKSSSKGAFQSTRITGIDNSQVSETDSQNKPNREILLTEINYTKLSPEELEDELTNESLQPEQFASDTTAILTSEFQNKNINHSQSPTDGSEHSLKKESHDPNNKEVESKCSAVLNTPMRTSNTNQILKTVKEVNTPASTFDIISYKSADKVMAGLCVCLPTMQSRSTVDNQQHISSPSVPIFNNSNHYSDQVSRRIQSSDYQSARSSILPINQMGDSQATSSRLFHHTDEYIIKSPAISNNNRIEQTSQVCVVSRQFKLKQQSQPNDCSHSSYVTGRSDISSSAGDVRRQLNENTVFDEQLLKNKTSDDINYCSHNYTSELDCDDEVLSPLSITKEVQTVDNLHSDVILSSEPNYGNQTSQSLLIRFVRNTNCRKQTHLKAIKLSAVELPCIVSISIATNLCDVSFALRPSVWKSVVLPHNIASDGIVTFDSPVVISRSTQSFLFISTTTLHDKGLFCSSEASFQSNWLAVTCFKCNGVSIGALQVDDLEETCFDGDLIFSQYDGGADDVVDSTRNSLTTI